MNTEFKVIIEGVYIYHRHIESAEYNYEKKCIVVRTVSGKEHYLSCDDPEKLKNFIENLDYKSELMDII
jgi:hypothetical protein